MTEWHADAYAHASALQAWLAEKSLASLPVGGHERVLDVGCGDGRISAAIAARLPHGSVLGVDASTDMVAFAARTFPAALHPNLAFAVADAAQLSFVERFERVVSFNCLHWVRDQTAALRGIRAALAPAGRAHLRLVARGARRALEEVIEETRQAPSWAGYFSGYTAPYVHWTPDEYRALAADAHLHVDVLDLQQESWDFGSRAAFARFAAATFVEWTRRLPVERHAEFIADVLDRYAPNDSVFTFYQMEAALRRPG